MKKHLAALLLLLGFTASGFAQIIASFTPASPFLAALPGGTTVSGQTFTAGISGTAGVVTVLAQSVGAAPSSITFQLRSVTGGLPTSAILGTVSVAGSSLTNSFANFSADFSSQSIFLSSGQSYAITLSAVSLFGLGGVADAYAGGGEVISMNSGSFSFFPPPRDLAFSVAAAPAIVAVPEPSVYSLAGVVVLLGVGGCSRLRRRV